MVWLQQRQIIEITIKRKTCEFPKELAKRLKEFRLLFRRIIFTMLVPTMKFPPKAFPCLFAGFVAFVFTGGPVCAQQGSQREGGPFVRMVRHNDGSRTVTARSELDPGSSLNLGKSQTISTYDPEGDLRLKRIYQLNKYGKPETFIISDGAGRPLVEGLFTYDLQNRLEKEELFELPSKRPLRTQIHSYTAGNYGTVRTVNHGPLPPELLRWMDPDGNVAGVKSEETSDSCSVWNLGARKKSQQNAAGDGNEDEGGLFSRFRKKKK